MCEQMGMSKPSAPEIAAATSISRSYAWEILQGKATPSRSLAFQIYRKFGWKAPRIEKLSDEEIAQLELLDAKAA